MINGNPREFIDRIYSCQDTIFVYKGVKYWFQGYMPTDNSVHMEISQYQPSSEKCLWQYDGESIEECHQAFLTTPIFDGKNFWEIEEDLEWVDD